MTVFCNSDDVKSFAPVAAGFTSRFDGIIPHIIDSTAEMVRKFCRRNFDQNEFTEYYMSPDTLRNTLPYRVYVKEPPIEADTVFVYHDPGGTYVIQDDITLLVENIDYVVDYDIGMIEFIMPLIHNTRGLKIVYTGGYDSTDNVVNGPSSLKTGSIWQSSFMLQRIAASQAGEQEVGKGRTSIVRFTASAQSGLISEVETLIGPYRRKLMGRF